jgi:hypothetical protein
MRFEIWQAPFEQTSFGYVNGAHYERVWEGRAGSSRDFATTNAPDVSPLLEQIFHDFQRVDPETGPWPPEGYEGRSLSVGDVIVLDGWAPFSVESLGFAVAEGFV